jgi:hypothetical protein|tara:strand:+ start:178 stop:327 length:150 start_codon:yes stop_codon:yes gene_type:complete
MHIAIFFLYIITLWKVTGKLNEKIDWKLNLRPPLVCTKIGLEVISQSAA